MLCNEILQIVLEESETMITEWADTKDGPGATIIEDKIEQFLIDKGYTNDAVRLELAINVRTFILHDMGIMGW
jgi:hypothetical protein